MLKTHARGGAGTHGFFSVSHTTHHTTTHHNNTTTTPHGERQTETDRDRDIDRDEREEDKTRDGRREKREIHFQCGGACPFLVD